LAGTDIVGKINKDVSQVTVIKFTTHESELAFSHTNIPLETLLSNRYQKGGGGTYLMMVTDIGTQ
jgi:hypothetical protein